ncbi:hypothetical protein ACIOEX_15610 [Streptomyces sp. NPDC087850]|uniref:hypothetical protein n=1 Tax=Streptomyces sp. NPDC087850 TaxID=3365809 RepID=UPI003821A933
MGYGRPFPPASPPAAEDATQYIPPVPATDSEATQFIAPVPQGPGPVHRPGPGVLPPEKPAEATQVLPPMGSDADATQYIPPVQYDIRPGGPGERPPAADFDNLFRDGTAGTVGTGDSGSTQRMPKFDAGTPGAGAQPYAQQPPAQQPYAQQPPARQSPPPPYEPQGRSAGRRKSARVPAIAAAAVGIAVLGLGAGALMSGGGDDPKNDSRTVSATAAPSAEATTAGPPSEAPDPVKTQAEALDKLLADSSSSRESVIRSVDNIKSCTDLGQAAEDLHAAAVQREELVARLKELSVDKLPDQAELASSLTTAWQASASADEHYAAWARQAAGKRGCKGGHARVTGRMAKGNKASGEATAAKRKASGLWNAIAVQYDLTERAPTQL